MAQIGFYCPDGQRIKHEDCLNKCRMGERCLTRPTLLELAKVRQWKGKPSVTQCLNGTLEEYLKIKNDYYVNPKKGAFKLLGTRHHKKLEISAEKLATLPEEALMGEEVNGIADLLDEEDKLFLLADYKTWGAFKLAKVLGIRSIKVETDEVYKSGAKKGEKKTRSEIQQKDEWRDTFDLDMQLNKYRIMFESAGFPISKLMCQITVRDGNTYIAKQRGITEEIYYIPVNFLPDETVNEYFMVKSSLLINAMLNDIEPPKCSDRETWDGHKCQSYCDAAQFCQYAPKQQEEQEAA